MIFSNRLNNIYKILILFVFPFLSPTAVGETIFVYEKPNGSRLITDHQQIGAGYRLIKVYGDRESGSEYSVPAGGKAWIPLDRVARYDRMIRGIANHYGVDSNLVKAVIQVESGYDPGALSHKGAYGLMQLMPGTAKRYGVINRASPKANITAGVNYLSDLLQMFDQDVRLALAAYNAGENSVIRYRGIPPWRETIRYVDKVMNLHKAYTTL